MLQRVVSDASAQTQDHVRQMLHMMIDLVPGQVFRDIERFHKKLDRKSTRLNSSHCD
jgi:hypothetical protein